MEDPGDRLDELEAEADRLEKRSEEVGEQADRAEGDWEAKKQDDSVPGAQPSEAERDGGSTTADAADAAGQ